MLRYLLLIKFYNPNYGNAYKLKHHMHQPKQHFYAFLFNNQSNLCLLFFGQLHFLDLQNLSFLFLSGFPTNIRIKNKINHV